jgi:hypothetical protein
MTERRVGLASGLEIEFGLLQSSPRVGLIALSIESHP